MSHEEFRRLVVNSIQEYIDDFDRYGAGARLRVNPASHDVELENGYAIQEEIEDSDEAVENAAVAEGAATKEYTDYQVTQNPDFYPLRTLIKVDENGRGVPDPEAVDNIVANYY